MIWRTIVSHWSVGGWVVGGVVDAATVGVGGGGGGGGGVVAVGEQDQRDGEREGQGDGEADDQAGAGHVPDSLGTETARTRTVKGRSLGSRTRSRVNCTVVVATTSTWASVAFTWAVSRRGKTAWLRRLPMASSSARWGASVSVPVERKRPSSMPEPPAIAAASTALARFWRWVKARQRSRLSPPRNSSITASPSIHTVTWPRSRGPGSAARWHGDGMGAGS